MATQLAVTYNHADTGLVLVYCLSQNVSTFTVDAAPRAWQSCDGKGQLHEPHISAAQRRRRLLLLALHAAALLQASGRYSLPVQQYSKAGVSTDSAAVFAGCVCGIGAASQQCLSQSPCNILKCCIKQADRLASHWHGCSRAVLQIRPSLPPATAAAAFAAICDCWRLFGCLQPCRLYVLLLPPPPADWQCCTAPLQQAKARHQQDALTARGRCQDQDNKHCNAPQHNESIIQPIYYTSFRTAYTAAGR